MILIIFVGEEPAATYFVIVQQISVHYTRKSESTFFVDVRTVPFGLEAKKGLKWKTQSA